MLKKLAISLTFVFVFLGTSFSYVNAQSFDSQPITLTQLIDLLINLGVIAPDKIAAAKTFISNQNTGNNSTSDNNTSDKNTSDNNTSDNKTSESETPENSGSSTFSDPMISPETQTQYSGQSTELKLSYPANTVKAQMYVSCPNGVTVGDSKGNFVCNQYFDVTNSNSVVFSLINNNNYSVNIVAKYYTYTSNSSSDNKNTSASITIPSGQITQALSASCEGHSDVSASNATWDATASGGVAPYKYQWNMYGDVSGYGEGDAQSSNLMTKYYSSGSKSAAIRVTDNSGNYIQTRCKTDVASQEASSTESSDR